MTLMFLETREATEEKAREVEDVERRLARARLSDQELRDLEDTVLGLIDDVVKLPRNPPSLRRMDSYNYEQLLHGAATAGAATSRLSSGDAEGQRAALRSLRIALERMRQALRDYLEQLPVSEHAPAKEVARWLVNELTVPQAAVAKVLGVQLRTFQRWVSTTDSTRPQQSEERKLRTVAKTTNNLQHALSGPGIIAWFSRPQPALGGRAPIELLDAPDEEPTLLRLSTLARSHNAT